MSSLLTCWFTQTLTLHIKAVRK